MSEPCCNQGHPMTAADQLKWKQLQARCAELEAQITEIPTLCRRYEARCAAAKAKVKRQRTELRRLNKYLGPYWSGFRKGMDLERECRLRGVMNAAFGHEKVRAAEHAAIDAVQTAKEGKT